jgi:large subunit ribosomal protein L5
MARLKGNLQQGNRPRAHQAVRVQVVDGRPHTKIVLNMGGHRRQAARERRRRHAEGLGSEARDTKKKAIAGFKIREGYPIGCMVTLRQNRMYEFLDRLVSISLPRVRDFRRPAGRSTAAVQHGVKEQIIFPEIEYDKIDTIRR